MVQKFRVKRSYCYVNAGGRVHPEGSEVTLDDEDTFVKNQLWKLEPLEAVMAAPEPIPVPEAVKEAEELVDSLDFLIDPKLKDPNEPPKVVADPDAVKPGSGVEKEEAETMLDRVQKFIAKQEEEQKAKKGKQGNKK